MQVGAVQVWTAQGCTVHMRTMQVSLVWKTWD